MKKAPSDTTRTALQGLHLRCPPLPQTLMEAMALIEQAEQLDVGPVTDMVQRDPIVVARLLHIVNSAYYGLRHAVSSAERAVVMLGPVTVAGIVAGMNMLRLRSALEGPASRCFSQLIRHSIATAFLTRHILDGPPRDGAPPKGTGPARVGVSFTAGLLHDFGKITLVYNYPAEAAAFYEKQALRRHVRGTDLHHLEQLVFGCDHTEAGEYVARKLNFPDLLIDLIRYHHEPAPPQGPAELDRLLRATRAANLAAHAMGYPFPRRLGWKACAADAVWALLLQHDLPHLGSPTALLADVQTQQKHLDQYVQHMTVVPSRAELQQWAARQKQTGRFAP